MNLEELQKERFEAANKAQHILKEARDEDGKPRKMSEEERTEWEGYMAEADELSERIDMEKRQAELDSSISQTNPPKSTDPDYTPRSDDPNEPETRTDRIRANSVIQRFGLVGTSGLTAEERKAYGAGNFEVKEDSPIARELRELEIDPGGSLPMIRIPLKEKRRQGGDEEKRAQATTTGAAGGFLIPEGFVPSLVEVQKAFGGMRSVSTILPTATGNDLPVPTLDDTSNVGEIIDENAANNDQDAVFGQRILNAFKYSSKFIKVSIELMQDEEVGLPGIIGRISGTRIERILNTHLTTGDGSGKPDGVVPRSTLGATAAINSAITFAELQELKHSVDPAHRTSARFMLNDVPGTSTLLAVKQIRDADGNPIWQPGLANREPDTIDGDPYTINQDLDSIATTTTPVLYGDFSFYWIRDVMDIQLIRLSERFAELGQVAFLAIARHDGDLLNTAAVKHLVMPA